MQAWTLGRPDGARLVGEDLGAGEPLVLVHATGAGRSALAEVAARLSARLRVTTYDRRGWGESAGTAERADYWETHGDDLVAVLERLDAPAHVVGIGAGGLVALHAALQRPLLVRGLVLFETVLGAERRRGEETPLVRRVRRWLAEGDALQARRAFWRLTTAREDGPSAFALTSPGLQSALLDHRGPLLEELLAGTAGELRLRLGALAVPLHVLIGRESARPAYDAARRFEAVEDGFSALDQADALLPYTEPMVFAAHLLDTLGLAGWRALEAARLEQLRRALGLPRLQRLRARCLESRDLLAAEEGGAGEPGAELAELRPGSVYELTGADGGYVSVTDESGEDYLYPQAWFELLPIVWGEPR